MSGFTKLDSGIVHSTIWVQPHDVLRVWIAMLALANMDGYVRTAAPALAHTCMIPVDRMREILRILESPDEDSRSEAEGGRRLMKVQGGWWLVNHAAYRAKVSAEEKRAADRERIAAKRAESRDVSQTVADVAQADAEAEAEADAEADADAIQSKNKSKEQVRSRGSRLPTDWALPADWKEEARAERSELDLDMVAKKFKDYWHGVAGKDGIKLNWQATWRNWVRNEKAESGRATKSTKHAGFAERAYGAGGAL